MDSRRALALVLVCCAAAAARAQPSRDREGAVLRAQELPAQTVVEKNGPATLIVHAAADRDGTITRQLDVLKLTLRVEGSKTLAVKTPDKIVKSPGWQVLECSPALLKDLDKDRRLWEQTCIVEPLVPGALVLQVEPLETSDHGMISWKPLSVRIVTTVADPDAKKLRDDPAIEKLPPIPEPHWPWAWLGAAGGLGVVAALAFFVGRRRAPALAPPPEQRALRELDRLAGLGLPDKGKIERFHTLLAHIVRRYLERKFQLPARRRTTPEFLALLPDAKLPASQEEFLRDFLSRCDGAKFAGAAVSHEECTALAARARAFIRES